MMGFPTPDSVPLIICFGDSLTAGYQSPTSDHPDTHETPYGDFLQSLLGARAQVAVSGVCGELTGEMVMRFRQDVLDQRPAYVVVLGGTNDLGWNASPSDIMRNLLKMYESARSAGVKPVAVTVPSIRAGELVGETPPTPAMLEARHLLDDHIMRRQELNRLILDYGRNRAVACVDLFSATAEPATLRLAQRYSNDGLHLATRGYEKLAELLYQQVFKEL